MRLSLDVAVAFDLAEALGTGHFDFDLVRDEDAVDVAAEERPEDGEGGDDGRDVDFEDREGDGGPAVPGGVERRVGRCSVVDNDDEAGDGAEGGTICCCQKKKKRGP